MRVPKRYRLVIIDALELAAERWQRCFEGQGGCQPDNASYQRSLDAGKKAALARALIREIGK